MSRLTVPIALMRASSSRPVPLGLSSFQEPGAKFPTEERIQENQMDIVRLLVSHGADLDATDKSGASARDLALECDFYECVDLLEELHGQSSLPPARPPSRAGLCPSS